MIFSSKILEQHIAILGKTGSGKTVTAKGIVEHLLRKKERVCIVDPVSAWWGLRSDVSGRGSGFPVVIFGGQHGDVEIGGSHGAAIAEIVASSETPTIIDLKSMSVKDRTAFFTAFAVTIMQKNQGVLHMVIDEAHLFAPKGRVNSNQAGEMLSETNNLVNGGRGLGFRFILLTQRPAKLHNDCLAAIETLVAMRLTLPADRDAAEAWMKESASVEQGREVLESLPRLKTGEGWVWSPESDILQRTTFPMITTFDSSNPKNLHRTNVRLQSIDLNQIRLKLDKAATDIVNNDPVQLKRLLAKAQAELKQRTVATVPARVAADPDALKREFDRGADSVKRILGKELSAYRLALAKMNSVYVSSFDAAFQELNSASSKAAAIEFPVFTGIDEAAIQAKTEMVMPPPAQALRLQAPPRDLASTNGSVRVPGNTVAQKILNAIAELEMLEVNPAARVQVGFMLGYSNLSSKGFRNAIGELRSLGLIDYPNSESMALTDSGRKQAAYPDKPATERDHQSRIINLIGGVGGKIIGELIGIYPNAIEREELGSRCGYNNLASKGFRNAIGRLRTLGFVEYPDTKSIKATKLLFLQ